MRVEFATEAEALASLPGTFDLVEGEAELTQSQIREATQLVQEAATQNPFQKFFRIILDS